MEWLATLPCAGFFQIIGIGKLDQAGKLVLDVPQRWRVEESGELVGRKVPKPQQGFYDVDVRS